MLVIQKLQEKLYILKGRTIGILGLAFKPNTDDLRDAPESADCREVATDGACVRAYDPVAMQACREQHPDLKLSYCPDAMSVANKADAIVLVTEWPEFKNLNLAEVARKMAHPVMVDGRNLFDPETRDKRDLITPELVGVRGIWKMERRRLDWSLPLVAHKGYTDRRAGCFIHLFRCRLANERYSVSG